MDKPDNKKAAVWRRKGVTMTEQDKTALLERGRDCLTVLRSIFDDCLQARNIEEAARVQRGLQGVGRPGAV